MSGDIEKIMSNVKFKCHKCERQSGCQRLAGDRDEMQRLKSSPNERSEIQVYCEHCGAANTVPLTEINIADIVSNFLP